MRAVCAQDQSAFEALYARYAPVALALARRVLGGDELAEDAVQTVFLDLWRHPHRFDPSRGGVASWLLTMTHHRAVDLVRREDRHRRRRAVDECLELSPTQTAQPDELVIDMDRRAQLCSALARLTPAHRQTLQMAYFGGFTYREIAHVMNVPVGTAKSRGHYGLSLLGGLLADVG